MEVGILRLIFSDFLESLKWGVMQKSKKKDWLYYLKMEQIWIVLIEKLRCNVFHDEFDISSIPVWWDAMQNKKKKSMKIWFTLTNNMQSCLEIWKQNQHSS